MMHVIRNISYVVLIMGALLTGINGLFNYDLVSEIFGSGTVVTRIMYAIVGIAGLVVLIVQNYEQCCACPDTDM